MKEISYEEYKSELDKLIEQKLPVEETLVEMLDYAKTITIKDE